MASVPIRTLQTHASSVVDEVVESGRPLIVTRNGQPLVAVIPVDQQALEDWVLSTAPSWTARMDEVEDDVAAGRLGVTHEALLADRVPVAVSSNGRIGPSTRAPSKKKTGATARRSAG